MYSSSNLFTATTDIQQMSRLGDGFTRQYTPQKHLVQSQFPSQTFISDNDTKQKLKQKELFVRQSRKSTIGFCTKQAGNGSTQAMSNQVSTSGSAPPQHGNIQPSQYASTSSSSPSSSSKQTITRQPQSQSALLESPSSLLYSTSHWEKFQTRSTKSERVTFSDQEYLGTISEQDSKRIKSFVKETDPQTSLMFAKMRSLQRKGDIDFQTKDAAMKSIYAKYNFKSGTIPSFESTFTQGMIPYEAYMASLIDNLARVTVNVGGYLAPRLYITGEKDLKEIMQAMHLKFGGKTEGMEAQRRRPSLILLGKGAVADGVMSFMLQHWPFVVQNRVPFLVYCVAVKVARTNTQKLSWEELGALGTVLDSAFKKYGKQRRPVDFGSGLYGTLVRCMRVFEREEVGVEQVQECMQICREWLDSKEKNAKRSTRVAQGQAHVSSSEIQSQEQDQIKDSRQVGLPGENGDRTVELQLAELHSDSSSSGSVQSSEGYLLDDGNGDCQHTNTQFAVFVGEEQVVVDFNRGTCLSDESNVGASLVYMHAFLDTHAQFSLTMHRKDRPYHLEFYLDLWTPKSTAGGHIVDCIPDLLGLPRVHKIFYKPHHVRHMFEMVRMRTLFDRMAGRSGYRNPHEHRDQIMAVLAGQANHLACLNSEMQRSLAQQLLGEFALLGRRECDLVRSIVRQRMSDLYVGLSSMCKLAGILDGEYIIQMVRLKA